MRRSSLPLILFAASLSACGDPTGPTRELEITLKGPAAPFAYLDAIRGGVDGTGARYHTCDDVRITAEALHGDVGDVATWGTARLSFRGLATNAKLAEQSFSASEVAGWWGTPEIRAKVSLSMFWDVSAKEAFRAELQFEYTVTKSGSGKSVDRVAEFSFLCEYKPG